MKKLLGAFYSPRHAGPETIRICIDRWTGGAAKAFLFKRRSAGPLGPAWRGGTNHQKRRGSYGVKIIILSISTDKFIT